jgi:hypothetical protein
MSSEGHLDNHSKPVIEFKNNFKIVGIHHDMSILSG